MLKIIIRSDCSKVFILQQKNLLGELMYFIDCTGINKWKWGKKYLNKKKTEQCFSIKKKHCFNQISEILLWTYPSPLPRASLPQVTSGNSLKVAEMHKSCPISPFIVTSHQYFWWKELFKKMPLYIKLSHSYSIFIESSEKLLGRIFYIYISHLYQSYILIIYQHSYLF